MKPTILFIIIAITLAMNSYSQDIPLIYTENAEWEYAEGALGTNIKYHITACRDTLMDQKNYTLFRTDSYYYYPSSSELVLIMDIVNRDTFYIRIENEKVYRRESSGQDSIIFDATWAIADTIVVDELGNRNQYILKSIDSISLGGANHRRWTFSTSYVEDGIFVEGIGGMYVPMFLNPLGAPDYMSFESTSLLSCFKLNGEYLVSNRCEIGTQLDYFINDIEIKLFPNPVSRDLTIQSDYTLQSTALCKIIDLSGQVLYSWAIDELNTQICLPEDLAGIFIIEIRNDELSFQDLVILK